MRNILFFLIATISVILIVVLFFIFQMIQPGGQKTPGPLVIPTPIETNSGSSTAKPPVIYNKEKTDELVQKAKTRQPLSAVGTAAKAKLLTTIGNQSGKVYSSSTVIIEYTLAPDLFQGEILTPTISTAKQEATNWLISQGFTKEDVCNLPFSFYLSPAVSSQLQNTNTAFNPLPDGC